MPGATCDSTHHTTIAGRRRYSRSGARCVVLGLWAGRQQKSERGHRDLPWLPSRKSRNDVVFGQRQRHCGWAGQSVLQPTVNSSPQKTYAWATPACAAAPASEEVIESYAGSTGPSASLLSVSFLISFVRWVSKVVRELGFEMPIRLRVTTSLGLHGWLSTTMVSELVVVGIIIVVVIVVIGGGRVG